MTTAMSGRVLRRIVAMGAGAALVAAGLSLGAVAPANAASTLTGGVTDGFGNPIAGTLNYYRQATDGSYAYSGRTFVDSDGYIEGTLSDGVYKFEFQTSGDYTEYYKDKGDLATADGVTVSGTAPTTLGSWTIDQPYVVGSVVNGAGKPLSARIEVFDAASGVSLDTTSSDAQGSFKIATQPAPVKLSFSADDYALEYYADAADLASAAPVTSTATGANIGTVVLAPGGSVSGQVTSEAGVPLEFVEVYTGGQSDYTDKLGFYTVKNARTGQQVVEFYDPLGEYSFEYYNNVTDRALATPVSVGVGQAVTGINAALAPRPADPTVRTTEVTGSVKDNLGVPIVGARLTAYTTPARPSDRVVVESVYSNRQGVFAFTELEKVQGENQFKVAADAREQGDDNAFTLFGSWFGGGQSYDRAPAVTVTPGVPVRAVDVVLERAGGIAGSVTGLPGTPLRPFVSLLGNHDGAFIPAGADFEPDSTFESRSLRAGTYKVRFDDSSGFHAGEWWKDKAEVDDAVLITVRSGQLVSGLAAVLGNQLAAVERPSLSVDYPWVGHPITARPGVWNVHSGTDFDSEWLVGSTVVGSGETFTPTTAHIGDRLTLRVTAENRELVGSATAPTSVKVGYKPKIKVKTAAGKATIKIRANPVKGKKIKGKMVVKEIVKVRDNGTIKFKLIDKAKIKKGVGAVSLARLKKGKHKLVFFFKGKGKVGSNDERVKVKIRR